MAVWEQRLERHWLVLGIIGLTVFVGLPLVAPVLAMSGQEAPSRLIYTAYRIVCHQLPQRSWFIGGPALAYDWEDVQPFTNAPPDEPLMAFHNPIRDPALGYQMAWCQRNTAIFFSFLMAALLYAAMRRTRRVSPLPLKWYALLVLPIAVDGVTQLAGLRESTPLLRTLTGAIFGVATCFLVLPILEAASEKLRVSM